MQRSREENPSEERYAAVALRVMEEAEDLLGYVKAVIELARSLGPMPEDAFGIRASESDVRQECLATLEGDGYEV